MTLKETFTKELIIIRVTIKFTVVAIYTTTIKVIMLVCSIDSTVTIIASVTASEMLEFTHFNHKNEQTLVVEN